MELLKKAPTNSILRSTLIEKVARTDEAPDLFAVPTLDSAMSDVDCMFLGFRLHQTKRFHHQRYWGDESVESDHASKIEGVLRLESVAEHSWHVADTVLVLAPHFPRLSVEKCLGYAVLHDKLEIFTGDFDPVGSRGDGSDTHAFSRSKRLEKEKLERVAAKRYLASLNANARDLQKRILSDFLAGSASEVKLVKAADKLQALCYVIEKKRGNLDDHHIYFTIKYSRKSIVEFPAVKNHYAILIGKLLASVAEQRAVSVEYLERSLFSQYEFEFGKSQYEFDFGRP